MIEERVLTQELLSAYLFPGREKPSSKQSGVHY